MTSREKKVLKLGKKHLRSCCKAVDKIAQPLFESFDLTFFSYKRSKGDDFLFLTNNYSWLMNCIDKDYVHYLSEFHPEQDLFIWDAIRIDSPLIKIYQDAKENFNIDHGITIIKTNGDLEEHFNFATTNDNSQMNNFYMHHIEILERFIIYFKSKAAKLIELSQNQVISLKEVGTIRSSLQSEEFYRDIDFFFENTQIKNIEIYVNSVKVEINYTLAQTAYFLLKGFSYKEIAKNMYVSLKTIEARLAKLRKLTDTKNKSELIKLLSQPEIKKVLDVAFKKANRFKKHTRGWTKIFRTNK